MKNTLIVIGVLLLIGVAYLIFKKDTDTVEVSGNTSNRDTDFEEDVQPDFNETEVVPTALPDIVRLYRRYINGKAIPCLGERNPSEPAFVYKGQKYYFNHANNKYCAYSLRPLNFVSPPRPMGDNA